MNPATPIVQLDNPDSSFITITITITITVTVTVTVTVNVNVNVRLFCQQCRQCRSIADPIAVGGAENRHPARSVHQFGQWKRGDQGIQPVQTDLPADDLAGDLGMPAGPGHLIEKFIPAGQAVVAVEGIDRPEKNPALILRDQPRTENVAAHQGL
jgi:hypothetical protein